MMREHPGIAGFAFRPFDLFAFANGDPARAHQLIDEGVFPWWTDPTVVLAFLRPITSATHYFDHLLWPELPAMMHVQSLVWFALLLGVVGAIYRRFMPSAWTAGLALLLYAVDDARATTVAWLANRNALVALTLALPALLAYDKWRRDGVRAGAWLGPLALAIGLFAGEAALTVLAYLVAYALFLDDGSLRARLLRLTPYAAVVLVWRSVYAHLGYGSARLGHLLRPGSRPAWISRSRRRASARPLGGPICDSARRPLGSLSADIPSRPMGGDAGGRRGDRRHRCSRRAALASRPGHPLLDDRMPLVDVAHVHDVSARSAAHGPRYRRHGARGGDSRKVRGGRSRAPRAMGRRGGGNAGVHSPRPWLRCSRRTARGR